MENDINKFNSEKSAGTEPLLDSEEISWLLSPYQTIDKPSGISHFSALMPQSSPKKLILSKAFSEFADQLNNNLPLNSTEIWFEDIKICGFAEYINSLGPLYLCSTSVSASGFLFFSCNSVLILTTTYLGGNDIGASEHKTYFTNIEIQLISKISEKIYQLLSSPSLLNIDLSYDTTISSGTEIIPNQQTVLISRMQIDMNGHTGRFDIVIPYDRLTDSNLLGDNKNDPSAIKSGRWKQFLANRASASELELTAVLATKSFLLEKICSWKIGDIIPLDIAKTDEISIMNKDKVVLRGITGRKNNNIAIKITNKVIK